MPERIAAYEVEARLLRWGDSSTAGRTITLEIDPDTGEQHPFRGYSVGKSHGQRFKLLFMPISDDETVTTEPASVAQPEVQKSSAARDAYRMKDAMAKAASRAGMLRSDWRYHMWLRSKGHTIDTDEMAAEAQRKEIGVLSCSEITYDDAAYQRYLAHEHDFREAAGLAAERR